ncbi:MAG: IS481 family transposase [Candidatus Hydrogenedentes bacterium]|nr:IS481 family transposase [Candidatus Hydrogenedentota bacterium]
MDNVKKQAEEEQRRVLALERFGKGEEPEAIWVSLGRSKSWFYKWVARERRGGGGWFEEGSRRPAASPNRTPGEIEEIVKMVRLSLYNKGEFCGAQAILWEMEDLDVIPLPSPRTVNRILVRNDLTNKRTGRYEPKGKKYPALGALKANDVHQMDFVGPRYLQGAVKFYSLHSVDIASRRCAVEPVTQGKAKLVEHVWNSWSRLGVPRFVQIDNEMVFYGSLRYPRGMGKLIRLCLLNAVEPLFIPQREPWRNGIVEKFNDHWAQKFFQRERMSGTEELKEKSLAFEGRHNSRWRYSALKGKSPLHSLKDSGVKLRFPESQEAPKTPLPKPEQGRYHVVRFIRSDGMLDIFGEKFALPSEAIYEYVKATVDVAKETLQVRLDQEVIDEWEYKLR